MKRLFYSILLISLIFSLSSCEEIWLDCIEGNNNTVVVDREISSFDEIIVTGPFDVYVSKTDSVSLRIDAEENLIPEIETRIVGQKLYVESDDNHCLRNNLPIKVYVSSQNLKEAKLTGSGLISIDTINHEYCNLKNTGSGDIEIGSLITDRLKVKLTGSGDIEAQGKAKDSELELLGSGNIRTINLEQKTNTTNITGSGDAYVYVTDELDAKITGSGDIYYKGSPKIKSDITGTGKIRKY